MTLAQTEWQACRFIAAPYVSSHKKYYVNLPPHPEQDDRPLSTRQASACRFRDTQAKSSRLPLAQAKCTGMQLFDDCNSDEAGIQALIPQAAFGGVTR